MASLAFYLFSSTHLIKSIKHEHLCKILYFYLFQISLHNPCFSINTSSSGLGENQLFSQIGLYRGNVVAVKKLNKYHLNLDNSDNIELTNVGHLILTLDAPIATKVVCFSRLMKCLRSLYGKQYGPRSDCSSRSSLF